MTLKRELSLTKTEWSSLSPSDTREVTLSSPRLEASKGETRLGGLILEAKVSALDGAVRHRSSTTLRKADKRTISKPGRLLPEGSDHPVSLVETKEGGAVHAEGRRKWRSSDACRRALTDWGARGELEWNWKKIRRWYWFANPVSAFSHLKFNLENFFEIDSFKF